MTADHSHGEAPAAPSVELEPKRYFPNPLSGEALTLDSPIEDLASYLADVREYESRLREDKAAVNRVLLAYLDKRRKWTLPIGDGLKITAPSDEPGEEWDAQGLFKALRDLVEQDLLAGEAVLAAIEIVPVQFKVRKAGLNALRKNPEIARVVDAFRTEIPAEQKPRYVSVKPV